MIELSNGYWAVEVPEGAERFEVSIQDDGIPCYTYWYKDNVDPTVICLPPGNWQIVCTSKEATEKRLSDVVHELPVGQRFENYCGDYPIWYHNRKESLRSLLATKGCDLNKIYLILKKQ